MQTIRFERLEKILRDVRGTTAVTITALTEPDMVARDNPYAGRVRKRSRRNCLIGFGYENAVNNQRLREDKDADFVAGPRKWGVRIAGTPIVEHKGKVYLEAKVQRVLEYRYEVDGEIVENALIEPWLRDKGAADRQELAKPVELRDFALTSITDLVMGGYHYHVSDVERGRLGA